MSADAAVRDLLVTAQTALGPRIYPLTAPPEAARPFAVMTRVSTVRDQALDGPGGLARARLQLDIYAATVLQARSISTAVRAALDGFSGAASGVTIHRIALDGEQEQFDAPGDLYRTILDLLVWFAE